MLHYFALDHYSTESLLIMLMTLVIGGCFVGYITDYLLEKRGFGPFGNGFLAILGCFSGVYARNAFVGHIFGNELIITELVAASGATAMLLILGSIKHWMSD